MGTEAGLRELGTSRAVPIGTKARSKLIKKGEFAKTHGGAAGTQDRTAPGGLPWDQQGGPDGNRSKTARNDQSQSRGTDTRSVRIGNHVLVQIPKQVR